MRELDWLILRKLYEKRSISKAAEDLYVTQSALTKRVKTIEQEWGVEVVKRSSQGVTFTEDGRYLVKKAGIMLDFLGEIREHFSERHGVKELVRVGVPNSFARLHMPKLLKVGNRLKISIHQLCDPRLAILCQNTSAKVLNIFFRVRLNHHSRSACIHHFCR